MDNLKTAHLIANPCKIKNEDLLKKVIDLLQVNEDDMKKALTIKTIETAKQSIPTPLSKT